VQKPEVQADGPGLKPEVQADGPGLA
jgi:hypothetical protein